MLAAQQGFCGQTARSSSVGWLLRFNSPKRGTPANHEHCTLPMKPTGLYLLALVAAGNA